MDEEDVDGWFEAAASSARSTPQREEFAELLVQCGGVPLDDRGWGLAGQVLKLLESRNSDAVAELVRYLQFRPARAQPAVDGDAGRSVTLPPESKLAGPEWRTFWEQHRQRVLEAFRPVQRAVLEALDLPGVLPLAEVADYLLGRVFPTMMSLELRQHLFARTQQARAAAGFAPLAEEERPSQVPSAEGETLSIQMPTVTIALDGQPIYSEAPLVFGPDDTAVVRLRDAAQAIVQSTGCPGVEAVAWLLADELPLWPLLALRSQVCRWNGSPPHNHRYTIEVGSGLVPPDEVARFYRQQRDKDAWAGLPDCDWTNQPRAFTAELLAFVRDECPDVPAKHIRDWSELHRRWSKRYPQKPYRNWRAMRETYLRVAQRARGADDGVDGQGI
jgi:hypothetical protein